VLVPFVSITEPIYHDKSIRSIQLQTKFVKQLLIQLKKMTMVSTGYCSFSSVWTF